MSSYIFQITLTQSGSSYSATGNFLPAQPLEGFLAGDTITVTYSNDAGPVTPTAASMTITQLPGYQEHVRPFSDGLEPMNSPINLLSVSIGQPLTVRAEQADKGTDLWSYALSVVFNGNTYTSSPQHLVGIPQEELGVNTGVGV